MLKFRPGDAWLWVVGIALGLSLGFVATESGLPMRDELGSKGQVSGAGFVLLVVVGIVAVASLASAMRHGRARRAGRPRRPD